MKLQVLYIGVVLSTTLSLSEATVEQCGDGQVFCCAPATSGATMYTFDQAVGCVDSEIDCEGFTVSAGEDSLQKCFCGAVMESGWYYDCDEDQCVRDEEVSQFDVTHTRGLCEFEDAVQLGVVVIIAIIISTLIGVGVLVGFCIFCCIRQRNRNRRRVNQHPQLGQQLPQAQVVQEAPSAQIVPQAQTTEQAAKVEP